MARHYAGVRDQEFLDLNMPVRRWRLLTIMLTALSLGPALGYLLELPAKMTIEGALWLKVSQTLYATFGTVGAVFEVGAVVATVVLVMMVWQRRPAFDWTIVAAGVVVAAVVGCPSMSLAKSTRRIMAPRGEVVLASDGDLAAFDPVNYAAVRRVGDVPTSPADSSDPGPATAWGPLRSGSRCDARSAPSSVHSPPQGRALVT